MIRLKRVSMRRIILAMVLGALILQIFFVRERIVDNFQLYSTSLSESESSFERSNQFFKNKLHYNNYVSSIYEKLLAKQSTASFKRLSKPEKCEAFFNQVDEHFGSDWKLETYEGEVYESDITNKKKFYEKKVKEILTRKKRQKKPEEIILQDKINISNQFYNEYTRIVELERKLADSTTVMRVFSNCYMNSEADAIKDDKICNMAYKVFPWLTDTLPVFERFDKSYRITDGFPDIDKFLVNKESELPSKDDPETYRHKYDSKKHCYLDYFQKKINGRGIVISCANKHVKDVIKLLRVLRGLNNKLPIQIIHKDDISKKNIQAIVTAARELYRDIPHFEKLPSLDEIVLYPPQELWFVGIKQCIAFNMRSKFLSYSNKLLAFFFNSFKEFLLIDADVVPLVELTKFFETSQYKKTSTIFYKDRSLNDVNSFFETNLLTKLASNEMDEEMFGIKAITNHTLNNHYMAGHRHYMEAGIVGINKQVHFAGIFMMLQLHLWQVTQRSVWGDKEMYWLGLSLMGDENYAFNENFAASIGELSKKQDHHFSRALTNEICSSHPGHVSSDDMHSLMWINSGFKFCKKNGHFKDRNRFPFPNYNNNELSSLYSTPLRITHSLIPPHNVRPEVNNKELDSNKNEVEIFPNQPWYIQPICSYYQYCAYDVVGNSTYDNWSVNEANKGTLIAYDEKTVNKFNYLGYLWYG